ncbi:heterokaryon incompatibility protein-domain-containing protein [Whalleya microplaca]|nr:heterokaryon incompatibility protein-domain-containing protein [Whalleya microplaca]
MDCSRCRATILLLCSENRSDGPYPLHRNAAELMSGVKSGCWWCIRVFHHMRRKLTRRKIPITYTLPNRHRFSSGIYSLGNFSRADNLYIPSKIKIAYVVEATSGSIRFDITHYEPVHSLKISERTDSLQSWNYITKRLDNCENNHRHCRRASEWYPSRLVEISSRQTELYFRVISTSESKIVGGYITLSHRWFPDDELKLTEDTLDHYQKEISSDLMPKKFLDAVMVAQKLGIRYLWIDSLCIIQDQQSGRDWHQESSMMGLIYQNGYCNLAAASATHRSEGLFYKRHPSQINCYQFDWPGKQRVYNVRQYDDNNWFRILDREPLYLRGWVCQERQLATRNISFTGDMIYFECAEEKSYEFGDPDTTERLLSNLGQDRRPPLTIKTLSHDNASQYWWKLIEHYSHSNLTFPDDKLTALSGIASIYHETIQSEYLAGLWKTNLPHDLLWVVDLGARPKDYRAPSWSWASIDGPIVNKHWGGTSESLVDIIDAYATSIGSNKFGPIRDARIQLTGWLFPLFSGDDALGNEELHSRGALKQTNAILQQDISERSAAQFDLYEGPRAKQCYVLPIARSPAILFKSEEIHGLLLEAVKSSSSGRVYQRIGHVVFSLERGDDGREGSVLEKMIRKWGARDIPSHKRMSDGRYRVTLV